MSLVNHKFWIFDMDGTLTMAIHDFEAIRQELGITSGTPILEAMAAMPEDEARECGRRLHDLEMELAHQAMPQPGVFEVLDSLVQKDCRFGILTRNDEDIALATLEAAGLAGYFEEASIVGRETCAPKPLPDGVHHLLNLWDAPKNQTVMVGDYLYDIQAGFEAGVTTVHFDHTGNFPWPEYTHYRVERISGLVQLVNPDR